MDIVEIVSTTLQLGSALRLLLRCDEILWFTDVRLVAKQTFTWLEQRTVVAEDLDVRRDTKMRSTVPDDITTVVADALHLAHENNRMR